MTDRSTAAPTRPTRSQRRTTSHVVDNDVGNDVGNDEVRPGAGRGHEHASTTSIYFPPKKVGNGFGEHDDECSTSRLVLEDESGRASSGGVMSASAMRAIRCRWYAVATTGCGGIDGLAGTVAGPAAELTNICDG